MIHVSHVICHTLTLIPRGYYKPPIPSKTPTPTPQYPSPLQCARVVEGKGGGRKCLPWGYPCHSLFTTTEYALHEHLAVKSLLFFLLLLTQLPKHFYPLPIPFRSFALLPLLATFVYLVDRA